MVSSIIMLLIIKDGAFCQVILQCGLAHDHDTEHKVHDL